MKYYVSTTDTGCGHVRTDIFTESELLNHIGEEDFEKVAAVGGMFRSDDLHSCYVVPAMTQAEFDSDSRCFVTSWGRPVIAIGNPPCVVAIL